MNNFYIGSVFRDVEKKKVIRNINNRWYVLEIDYKYEYYLLYVSGVGYFMLWDIVEKIVLISLYIKFIFIEDVYIGILV